MKKTALVLTTVGALGLGAVAAPSPAEARFRGFGPALAGGLIAGAVIGGLASSAYAYPYGYYDGYPETADCQEVQPERRFRIRRSDGREQ